MAFSRDFIPGTSPRQIAPNIFFQPIRSWHSNTYAGEGLTEVHGDGSGCLHKDKDRCSPPLTVTHRLYWNEKTGKDLSVFLSYPNGMGCCDSYFWEVYPVDDGDIARFDTETEMEEEVLRLLKSEEPVFKFPKGIIESRDQLWFGRRLWDVVNTPDYQSCHEVTVAQMPVPDECKGGYCPGAFWIEIRDSSGFIYSASLRDRNIGDHYNNNFLFSTEEDARAFLEPLS